MENYINQLIAHASKNAEANSLYQDAFKKRFNIREKDLSLVDVIEIAIRKATKRKKPVSIEDMAKNLLGKGTYVSKTEVRNFCCGYLDHTING